MAQPLPSSVTTSDNAAAERPRIDKSVQGAVTKLLSSDAATQKQGRDELLAPIERGAPSASFLDQYAASLNAQLVPAEDPKRDIHSRLNAAVVTCKIAQAAAKAGNNTALIPAALAFMKDPSDGVALWGAKAGKYLLPAALQANVNPQPLLQGLDDALKNHSTEAVAEEVFEGISLHPLGAQLTGITAPMALVLVPEVFKLLSEQIDAFATAPPPQPVVLSYAADFLVAGKVWAALKPPQQSQALANIVALMKAGSKQFGQAPQPELIDMIRRLSRAVQAVADRTNNAPLRSAASALTNLGNEPSPEDIDNKIDTLEKAIEGLGLPTPSKE